MTKVKKITDYPSYSRDMNSSGVVNTNSSAFSNYMENKINIEKEKESVRNEINSIKNDLSEIKSILKTMITKE